MLQKLRAAQEKESGFTLVELLLVVAILGVLAGVVVFSVAGIQDNSQKSSCKTEASTVRSAEEAYYVKNKSVRHRGPAHHRSEQAAQLGAHHGDHHHDRHPAHQLRAGLDGDLQRRRRDRHSVGTTC